MNNRVRNLSRQVLSDNWYTLNQYTFEYQHRDGRWREQSREAYDRGNGAAILLYNSVRQTVILTRQFRLPTFINGNPAGMLVEACAGLLERKLECKTVQPAAGEHSAVDRSVPSGAAKSNNVDKQWVEESAEACIVREVEEETGYKISRPEKIGEAYMSPGAVTEIIHFFIAEYADNDKVGEGGGLLSEHEDIEVLELDFAQVWSMLDAGEIRDAKTIILLQHAKLHNIFSRR